jgi:hypothetical protein
MKPMKFYNEDSGQEIWEKTTLKEIAIKNFPVLIRETGEYKAFGYACDQWLALLDAMQPGDELYNFRTSAESWKGLYGRAGLALVRNDEIVATVITMMN